jgi:signal transduction histidine kinase
MSQLLQFFRNACLLMAACLYAGGCGQQGKLPIGTAAEADSLLIVKGNEFESGQVVKAMHHVDSMFRTKSEHTVYEYSRYYATAAYVNGIMNKTQLQMLYLDSCINLLRQYPGDPGLTDLLSGTLMGRGDVKFHLKKYAESYNDFFEAMQLARNSKDVCRKMRVPYTIAMILYRQQQWAASGQYFKESLQYIDSCEKILPYINNKRQEVLDNIGLCYTQQKKHDSAMLYYRQALALVMQNPYQLAVDSTNSQTRYAAALGVIYGNMAKVHAGKGNKDSAVFLFRRAIDLQASKGFVMDDMQLCMLQLSEIYLSQKKLAAMQQTLQSLAWSMDTIKPSAEIRIEYERLMYAYHNSKDDAVMALRFLTSYIHLKDSAAEQQKLLLQTDISKELKDKQQQFEIDLLQKNNELNRTYLAVLIVLSALIIVILVLIYSLYRSSAKKAAQLSQLNQQISGQKQALEQASEEKDRILRVVAHDLRNPIGGIGSLSQLMLSSDMVTEEGRTFVQTIAKASASATALIQELLNTDTPQLSAANRIMTDMGLLLQQVVQLAQFKAAEKKQVLQLHLPPQPLMLLTHPNQIERVVNNLLVNAIKFSPAGAVTHISLQQTGNEVQIIVRDAGIGIAPENLPLVFDRFGSLKRAGTAGEKSFGLGLSICRQIVGSMGGRIWVESEPGKGSVFYIALPVY